MSEPLFACTGRRHKGHRLLPRDHFGRDARKPEGRCAVCHICRREACARNRANQKAAERFGSSAVRKRQCKHPGCHQPPEHRGTRYCVAHRKRVGGQAGGGRGVVAVRPSAPERTTWRDYGISMLIGSGRKPGELEW